MKILLVGEYSRLHNSLKEGLTALGHEVTLIACGDYFKDFPADIKLRRTHTHGWRKTLKNTIYRLTGIDVASKALENQFFSHAEELKGYDVVQLINESPFGIAPDSEQRIIDFLYQNNQKLFLLCCGADYLSMTYTYSDKLRYSIFTPLFEGRVGKEVYVNSLKYLTPPYKKLHDFIFERLQGVIATDLDYHLPMQGHEKYLGLIPNPINIEGIQYDFPEGLEPLVIFHGMNSQSYYKKGSDYFEAALDSIESKYSDRVLIITSKDLPYTEYMEKYHRAHILLDQVLAMDQGYNALEAMARGKVVFTGAEQEWLQQYGLDEDTVAINALPDVDALVEKLSWCIEHPKQLREISKNARAFVEREHDYKMIAGRYLKFWEDF